MKKLTINNICLKGLCTVVISNTFIEQHVRFPMVPLLSSKLLVDVYCYINNEENCEN